MHMNYSAGTGSIQGASLSPVAANTTRYIVSCRFLAGSDANGCRYILIGSDNTTNFTGIIMRQDSYIASAEVDIGDIGDYSGMVVYEIDENNETVSGSLPFKTYAVFAAMEDSQRCMLEPTQAGRHIGVLM